MSNPIVPVHCGSCEYRERLETKVAELQKENNDLMTISIPELQLDLKDAGELIKSQNEALEKYRNGYQGSCWCCESVGMKNIELEATIKRVSPLPDKWRNSTDVIQASGFGALFIDLNMSSLVQYSITPRDCADELEAALKESAD